MTILDRILDTKRGEVAARKAATTLSDLEVRMQRQTPPRGFRAALDRIAHSVRAELVEAPSLLATSAKKGSPSTSSGRTGLVHHALIAEIKKASPSKGLIREDFDPAAHARDYQTGGAACLSVLTDEQYFQGHDNYLIEARAACGLPVLRKDFTIDPWQAIEARAIGADAILVIMSALDDAQAADIEATALGLGMEVLVEVHDAEELERAFKLKSRLIGVNNRDLKDFSVDFERTYELIGSAPDGCTFVAESGLTTRADLDAMAERGVRCFLIGEALMRQDDLVRATRTFTS